MQRSAVGLLLCSLLFAALILWRFSSPTPASSTAVDELTRLRAEVRALRLELKEELKRKVVLLEQREQAATAVETTGTSTSSEPVPTCQPRHADNDTLLLAHRRWDWRAIVGDLLQPWPRIEESQVDGGVDSCHNSSMYCQRMQIYDGQLYITDYRAIFFDRHYAPARVMPILETLRRHPELPNVDLVVEGNDEPRIPGMPGDRRSWSRMSKRWPGGERGGALPPALFSSTVNRAVFDLPWVDFAWFFPRRPHKLLTPPWSVLHGQLYAAGGRTKWESKKEIAMHTWNVGSYQRQVTACNGI